MMKIYTTVHWNYREHRPKRQFPDRLCCVTCCNAVKDLQQWGISFCSKMQPLEGVLNCDETLGSTKHTETAQSEYAEMENKMFSVTHKFIPCGSRPLNRLCGISGRTLASGSLVRLARPKCRRDVGEKTSVQEKNQKHIQT